MHPASEENKFCANFAAISNQQATTAEAEVNGWVGAPFTTITLVNTKKAAGPDDISGRLLKLRMC